MEVFKNIKGYEGLYQIGNEGTIKSLWYGKERILKQYKNVNGYLYVILCKNSQKKTYKVHRIVAEHFIPNPDNLPQVNHKNEIKTDNRVENLEWCDAKYNANYGSCQQRRAGKLAKQVLQYTLDGEFVAEYPSASDANRKTGYNFSKIAACCRNDRKTAYGYKWRYKNEVLVQ